MKKMNRVLPRIAIGTLALGLLFVAMQSQSMLRGDLLGGPMMPGNPGIVVPPANIATPGVMSSFSSAPTGAPTAPMPPAMTITTVSPQTAPAGQSVTLVVNGTNFPPNAQVHVGPLTGLTTTFISSTKLQVVIPANASTGGLYDVRAVVQVNGGIAYSNAVSIILYPNTATTPPDISSISPDQRDVGSAPFNLRVNGTNFVIGSMVYFDAKPMPTTGPLTDPNGGTYLLAAVSAWDLSAPATNVVKVVNPGPGGAQSQSPAFFTVNATDPILTSVSPAVIATGAPDTLIVIRGSNFFPSTVPEITFQEAVVTQPLDVVARTPTEITARIPAGSLIVPATLVLRLKDTDQTELASGELPMRIRNAQPVPFVLSVTPSQGPSGGPNFPVTLKGSGFTNDSVVQLNGQDIGGQVVSGSEMAVAIPAVDMAAPGMRNITVFNPLPGGGLSNAVPFEVKNFPASMGELIIRKLTTGGDDEFRFVVRDNVTGAVVFDEMIETVNGDFQRTVQLHPGTYRVEEFVNNGWTLDSASCTADKPNAFLIEAGLTVSCTFRNTYTEPPGE